MASKQSGSFNIPLMILAFLTMAGFLYWLNIASEPTQIAVAEENGMEAMLDEATSVSPIALIEDAQELIDEMVRVPNIRVAELMGTSAFWFPVSMGDEEEQLYLVFLDPNFIDPGFQLVPDDVLTLTGTVREMSDQIITQWEEQGLFTEEGQRPMAAEVETFIQAAHLDVHTTAEEADDPDADDDDTEDDGQD
jgi:hypothetical protein